MTSLKSNIVNFGDSEDDDDYHFCPNVPKTSNSDTPK